MLTTTETRKAALTLLQRFDALLAIMAVPLLLKPQPIPLPLLIAVALSTHTHQQRTMAQHAGIAPRALHLVLIKLHALVALLVKSLILPTLLAQHALRVKPRQMELLATGVLQTIGVTVLLALLVVQLAPTHRQALALLKPQPLPLPPLPAHAMPTSMEMVLHALLALLILLHLRLVPLPLSLPRLFAIAMLTTTETREPPQAALLVLTTE